VIRWGALRAYSYSSAGTGPAKKQRSKKMFDGDYSYELATQRMDDDIKAHEHHRLVKQLRSAQKVQRTGMAARATAFVVAMFR
jgi:hypothetical protein